MIKFASVLLIVALGLALAFSLVRLNTPPTGPNFTSPTAITNLYLPLASLKQDILEGRKGSETVRVERTLKPGTKTFTVAGQTVIALIMEDRSFVNGELEEVALDYFAQSDDGTVYYLGEDVDIYQNGQVVSHEGAWLYGVDTNQLGVIMPAHPKLGDRFQAENVPGVTREDDEVVSVSESVTVPAGTYRNCVKIREALYEGQVEYKYYAPDVGVVEEVFEDGKVSLVSHVSASSSSSVDVHSAIVYFTAAYDVTGAHQITTTFNPLKRIAVSLLSCVCVGLVVRASEFELLNFRVYAHL